MSEARKVLEVVIEDFSADKFIRFFREKNRNFVARENNYSRYNDSDFKNGLQIGEMNLQDNDSLLVCAFEVRKPLSEKAGKKAQYEKAKAILKAAENQIYCAGIFIFYDTNRNFRFSLVYPEAIGTKRLWNNFRRFTYFVSKEFTNKTFLKQIGEKDFHKLDDIKAAFSITAVTDLFYDEFFKIYDNLVKETKKLNKIVNEEEARDFVLLFAIRTIFLGFIQQKKWLGNDEKFIQKFYQEYKEKLSGKNKFYSRWLTPLFFEALNSPQGRKVAYRDNDFSAETETKLQMAPYLNGGLFKQKEGYDTRGWFIPDKEIQVFFEFLFSHSFTIEENSLADEDLQLNPEFLGIIFERFINKADGAVYTPRTEVSMMCRLSLIKWLEKNLENKVRRDNLYELFFLESDKEEDQKQGSFSQKEVQEILLKLENLAVCDPAVGSGAFVVGMMQVIDEVEQSLKKRYGLNGISIFERKKQIIKNSLYGVEVKEWAVWICQLRLWLSLFVDVPDDLKNSLEPILPSLDFKVRQGDSLIQRIGAKAFPVSGHNIALNKSVKDKITKLRNLKLQYFDNKSELKDWELRQRELAIYDEIINIEISDHEDTLRILKNIKPSTNLSLFDEDKDPEQASLELNKAEIEFLEKEIAELKEQKKILRKEKPLIWSIEFADVFGEKGGFDIIIGNPPYVRQEAIADPIGKIKDKKEYKNCLEEMVRLDFPDDFTQKTKINAQSDLYTYFYIRGLRLLNPQGIHTFICSNSWLDVGYGVWLQDFLLKRCPVELIIDNHAKRSFDAADVNTIISIIHAPQKKVDENHLVKFVAFKKPFEESIFTENLLQIAHAKEILGNETFRVYPITVKDLKKTGTEYVSEEQRILGGKYAGDKWGGKYLRAPKFILDILYSQKVEPFLKVVDIKYGLKPGKVKFFYITKERAKTLKIESKYLKPAIISSQHINTIFIDFTHYIFSCLKSKKDISGTAALDYIKWGESNEMNSGASVESHRPYWYSLQCEDIDTIFFRFWDKRFFSPIANSSMCCSDNFCYGKFLKNEWAGKLIVNSTFYFLQINLFGNSNQGQGVLTTYMDYDYPFIRMPILDNKESKYKSIVQNLGNREIKSIFEECGINPKSDIPIEEQDPKPLPDRAELDKIVFDALELTKDERKDVYRAVCRLVWNRISKAKSV